MRVLVTGGSGFIGRHLTAALLKAGHDVVVLDLVIPAEKQDGVQYIKGDIRDTSDVARAIKGCTAVYHLAARTNVRDADEKADYEVNFLGAKQVFEAAQQASAKVIFTSSAAVYGDVPLSSIEQEPAPLSQYGKSKLKAERALLKELPESFVVRLFNVYGPGSNSVINVFCRNVPSYKPIQLFGNGMQTRDYIHVTDVVRALLLGLGHAGTFNIGSGRASSLLEVLDIIHEITRAKPEYKFELPKAGDVRKSKADISKTKAELSWTPTIDLKTGIEMTLQTEGWQKLPSVK